MAGIKDAVTYESIMRDIKGRKFSPIYILMGEESYFIDKICGALMESILPEDEREFNQFVVFGSDVNAGQVALMARELPMMSEYKVIVVKEAQNIKNTDDLEKYFDHPSPQTILVYCYKHGTIDKRKKFLSRAQEHGLVYESAKLKEKDLPGFVISYLKMQKVNIDPKTAVVIAESIGQDLNRLTSELDKLCLALPENDRNVTPELVEESIGVSKEFNSYELKNALVNRDVVKANRIINYFDKNPKSGGAFVLLNNLFPFFQNLMVAWYAPDRNSLKGLAEHLELRGDWFAKEYAAGMRTFSALKTMQIISKIREVDEKLKGLDNPNTTPGELMKELVFFILH